MADLGEFNAAAVEPSVEFEPLPEGIYKVMITQSEVKPTKVGTGSYLSLKLVVTEMEKYNGRVLWVNLNLNNPSEQAVEIAQRDLSAICHAVGVLKPGSSEALHDIPFDVKVGVEKRNDTGALANRVKSFLKPGGAAKEAAGAPASGKGNADWMSK